MNVTYHMKLYIIVSLLFLLSGCLFPEEELAKNQVPHEDQLKLVQTAVDQYREQSGGLVPIQTKSSDTPVFEKYLVDFSQLKEDQLISEVPGNAFENGGIYQYVLLTPEDDPRVKLIDLRTTNALQSVKVKLQVYRDKHIYPPFGEEIADGLYTVNYKELGLEEEPYVVSPFTDSNLPIIMDIDGNLYIDYRKDLMHALEEYDHSCAEGDDIRYLLAENTSFVPAHSLPYTVKDGEPIFLDDEKS